MKNEKTIDTSRRSSLKKIVLFPFVAATVLKKTGCRSKTEEIDPTPTLQELIRKYQPAVQRAKTYPRAMTTSFNEVFNSRANIMGITPTTVLDSARVTAREDMVQLLGNRESMLELQRLSRQILELSVK